jgi:hypothetical protein
MVNVMRRLGGSASLAALVVGPQFRLDARHAGQRMRSTK